MNNILSKELLIAVVISSLVFGSTGVAAYNIAAHLHQQGVELLKVSKTS